MLPPEQQKRATAKPSLLSASDQSGEPSVRILNNAGPVTNGGNGLLRSTRPALHPVVVGLVALILLVAVAMFAASDMLSGLFRSSDNQLVTRPSSTPADRMAKHDAPAVVPVPAVAQATPDIKPATPASEAATIITDETGLKGGSIKRDTPTSAPDQLTSALEAGIKPQPSSLKSALEASPVKVAGAPSAHVKSGVIASTVTKPASSKHVDAPALAKTEPKPAASKADSDVSLIAALVAHDDVKEHKHPVTAKSSKVAGTAKTKAGTKDGDTSAATETASSRLAKCRGQDFVDAEICRWHVCSGKWETEPACKVK